MPRKKALPEKVKIKRRYEYGIDGQRFVFLPGEEWKIQGKFPGDTAEKIISKEIYQYLKTKQIF